MKSTGIEFLNLVTSVIQKVGIVAGRISRTDGLIHPGLLALLTFPRLDTLICTETLLGASSWIDSMHVLPGMFVGCFCSC